MRRATSSYRTGALKLLPPLQMDFSNDIQQIMGSSLCTMLPAIAASSSNYIKFNNKIEVGTNIMDNSYSRNVIAANNASMNDIDYNFKLIGVTYINSLVNKLIYTLNSNGAMTKVAEIIITIRVLIEKDEKKWVFMMNALVNNLTPEDFIGPLIIATLLEKCPSPSKYIVMDLTESLNMTTGRFIEDYSNSQIKENTCLVVGVLAECLNRPCCEAILKNEAYAYFFTYMLSKTTEPLMLLRVLLALEKLALHQNNHFLIWAAMLENGNPLLVFEEQVKSEDFVWHQTGFVARWLLDNIFPVDQRVSSYATVDMTGINVVMDSPNVGNKKFSANGLEVRYDSVIEPFGNVKASFEVSFGAWYYEAQIISNGIARVGFATKYTFDNSSDDMAVGNDLYSIAYDGFNCCLWYNHNNITTSYKKTPWQKGDVVGCLLDVIKKEIKFFLNGQLKCVTSTIFSKVDREFFPAASLTTHQHIKFNFGDIPFKYAPRNRQFFTFNEHVKNFNPHSYLSLLPRGSALERVTSEEAMDSTCIICCDSKATHFIALCKHGNYCAKCITKLKNCPICCQQFCTTMVLP